MMLVDRTDNALHHHARVYAAHDLVAFDTGRGFWQQLAFPLSHIVKPVRHAIIALGGAHRCFWASNPAQGALVHADVRNEAIQKYNEAIQCIQLVMTGGFEESTTLTCCVIFICIENLLGRFSHAVCHLHAAIRLLNSHRQKLQHPPSSKIPGIYGLKRGRSTYEDDMQDIISEMIYWLSQNVALYTGDLYVPELDWHPCIPSILGDETLPFSSLQEARESLSYLDFVYEANFNVDTTSADIQRQKSCPLPLKALSRHYTNAANLTQAAYNIWSSRLDLFKRSMSGVQLVPHEQQSLAWCELQQALWRAFLNCSDGGYTKENSRHILERVEDILQIESAQTRPVFKFDGDLLSSVGFVCTACRDGDVRNRAISLLRSIRRRDRMASVLDGKVATWEALPWGATRLSLELSRLSDTS
ncbi:hypothetical protein FocTR4_00005915 [Fusarium oxysporum f. sp. cubense]|uniref:Transcription factor domain-containing protein n=1 Tax=Fusarium oxysporum f. sp. cubense TaxID=61366 RepID=A0A5C6TJ18_FUSOC|nr:hypothetical protein FocTR4_00005915 [Fusarium oxysporum f. sp. cubense]